MHYHALSYQYMQDKAFAAILETIFLARFDLNQKNAFFWKKFWLPENLPGTPRLNRTRHRREDREARTWPPVGLSPRMRRRPGARWLRTNRAAPSSHPSVKRGRQKRHSHLM
jgi:hypothetical protein